jgi:membrane protease YdiL (CAAX protease family)
MLTRKSALAVGIYVVVSYAWSWAWWLPLLISGELVRPGMLPTHLPGLAGPAVGAVVATAFEGHHALQRLWHRASDLQLSPLGWSVALSPLLFVALGLIAVLLSSGNFNTAGLGSYSGVPQWGVIPVFLLVLVVNGFGEELGWRGYLLPRLQEAFGAWPGTILVFPIWALWHLPLFAIIESFAAMDPITIVFGWALGLFAGNLVLSNVARLSGGRVTAPALWHTLYNFSAATGLGAVSAAVSTVVVIVWALGLIVLRCRKPSMDTLTVGNIHEVERM